MDQRLQEYAQLVIQVGLNVQKGQTLFLRAPVQCAEFARLCASAAYDVGCREVVVDFSDAQLSRMKYLRAEDSVFDECPAWFADRMNSLAQEGAAFLSIHAQDPNNLQGVNPDRIRRNAQASGMALQPYQAMTMSNQVRWCIVSAPIPSWSVKVFPDVPEEEAVASLWEAIYHTLRITGDGQAVARWQEHTRRTTERAEKLNALSLASLHYTNSLGTDLTVGLPQGALWAGGREVSADGIPFVANMPTEEIFTAPHRERVQGRVVSSMPFVLNGNVIRQFAFIFEDGKIVGIEAETEAEQKLLRNAISVDPGASYLGEVALVPFDSPISNLKLLFYNTLFDENASCHLAFGKAYPCIEGAENMDAEALLRHGINDSFTHQDFMIGTADLSITGLTEDGRQVPIFVDGNFAL